MLPEPPSHSKRTLTVKLHLAHTEGRNAVTAYGRDYVAVNQVRYQRSLVVLPHRLVEGWNASATQALGEEAVAFLATLGAEIVLIGTGETLRFPPLSALRPLVDAGIGFEVMDTNAACRTYNILMAEDRKVAAALLI